MLIQPRFQLLLKRAGNIISVAGVIFVALKLHKYGNDIDFSDFGIRIWALIFGLAFLYSIANPMLAFAWRNLLAFSGIQVTATWAFKIYGISQIAKYVPGNIFHLVGRQTMGMSHGFAGKPLFKSSAWELGLIAGTGFMFGVLTFPVLIPALSLSTAFLSFCSLCIVVFFGMFRVSPYLGRAFLWHLSFLTATGLIFFGLLYFLSLGDISASVYFLCGSYVLAWLAGLITPGAPAGVGVRELVLLLLLKGLVAEADLLVAVLFGRVVTVGGDILFFILSLVVYKFDYHN